MNVEPANFSGFLAHSVAIESSADRLRAAKVTSQADPLKPVFQEFVAGTFFQMMLKSLRKLHDKPAYFHGGRAEEIFRNQLDQEIVQDLTQHSGASFSDGLYQLFRQQQSLPSRSPSTSAGPLQTSSSKADVVKAYSST